MIGTIAASRAGMSEIERTPPSRKKRIRNTILIVVGVLLVIRIILPYVLLHVVNDRLSKVPGYYGHIDDLDLALIRGAYTIKLFDLQKVDTVSQERTPFLSAEAIDLSVEWKALFKGSVVGELVIATPEIRFTKDAVEPAAVQEDTTSLGELLSDLMPLQINRVELNNGSLRFVDPTSKPKVDIALEPFDLLARNLRNSYDSSNVLPATVEMRGGVYGGTITLDMKLNPLAEDPTFDLTAEVEGMELPQLNDFLQAYGKFDVNRGTFGLYSELAAKEGGFAGYVKPLIKDLDVVGREDRDDNLLRKLWEGTVGTVGVIFRNQPEDQVATKVEMRGRMDGPRTNVIYAIVDLLRNAFIQALQPSVDHEISLGSVEAPEPEKDGFIERFFNKDEKKKKK
jgi:hypothetical protein